MSANRQANLLGQGRIDIPHLRSIESSIAYDFDSLAGTAMAGSRALIVSGFSLVTSPSPIGGLATSAQLTTAGSVIMHPLASDSGTIFVVPANRAVETLVPSNTRVSGSFTAAAVNYVGIDLRRTADSTTSDQVQFLDPNSNLENPKTVPLARTMDYVIFISTQDFSTTPNIAPLAKITTDSNNNITVIEDARNFFFRLGGGGSSTNPLKVYTWPAGRSEVGNNSDFAVADKTITSFKDWMDSLMTRAWELGGGEHWYSPTADRNVKMIRNGATLAGGEFFAWDGTNLTWQGLAFIFDNSTANLNEVNNQTVSSAGLTDLLDGQCIYVDIDRTTLRTRSGANALTAIKGTLATLGTPIVPGSRHIIAYRSGANVFPRDSYFFVGSAFAVATTTALGMVKLNSVSATPAAPVVFNPDTNGTLNVTAAIATFPGIIAVGNTTGQGIRATGGASSAAGILGTGGAANGIGVQGQGTGTGQGVQGTGGATNGVGVQGTGAATGAGVSGTGGGTSGVGVLGVGGTTSGAGGDFTGAATSGPGVVVHETLGNNAPLAEFLGSNGTSARGIIDHNGFIGTLCSGQYRQQWLSATLAGIPDWQVTTASGGAGTTVSALAAGGVIADATPWSVAYINPGTANTNNCVLYQSDSGTLLTRTLFPSSNIVIVMEFIFTPLSSLANITWDLGLMDSIAQPLTSVLNTLRFTSVNGGAWQVMTGNTSGAAIVLTAVSPTVGTPQRFRIEWHGANTPFGVAAIESGAAGHSKARFFINGTRLLTFTERASAPITSVPTASFGPAFSGYCTGAATGKGAVGPVCMNWTHLLTPDLF